MLGDAHRVADTAMTALDWARPTEIPAIAAPASLPLGAGAAILNVVALLARAAGVAALRYAGPYPTAALWRSLQRSFRCDADEAAFTAGALDRALRIARDPIAIDFAPAPHERIAIPGGFVELRDGVERAVIDGVGYEPGGSPARLVAAGADGPAGGPSCEVWFGDACYARIATLAADGSVTAGPHPVPACTSPVLGRAFPAALQGALAELVGEAVPAPLAADARALLAAGALGWADLGARAARELPDGFAVHAALWDRIAPHGLGRVALALAEALAPVVAAAVARRAAAAASRG
ncbi:MAG TPA: hypothetical protein VK601_16210 [Kofleriaceae bacterium]|nr:hypothetical protein [Kofleriaceae bacterium]